MKSRKQKAAEYAAKYSGIPTDYYERLYWMYDYYNISPAKAQEIVQKRDNMLNTLYYKEIHIVLYEEPEGAKRPRARLVNRQNLVNMAMANSDFIHIYSPSGYEDNMYMKRMISEQDFIELNQLLAYPCNVEYIMYLKTPTSWSKTDTFLAEIGLERPIVKPDWDNGGKKYSDMMNGNVWIDDSLTIRGCVDKFYSILPRVEIKLLYMNMLYNVNQYRQMLPRVQNPNDLRYYMEDR